MMEAIWKRRNSDEGGFTLVELLVVIAILGILAAVAVFAISGTTATSKTAACSSDKATIQSASDANNAQTGSYAANITALVTAGYLRPLSNGVVTDGTPTSTYVINAKTLTYTNTTGLVTGSC